MLYGSAKAKLRRFSPEIRARERWAQASERDRRSAVSPISEMRALLITSREKWYQEPHGDGRVGRRSYPSPFGNQKEYLNASCRMRGSCELVIWPKVAEPGA